MIKYFPVEYIINFKETILWNRSPNMIFRSVLGAQLRRITCVIKDNKCESCMLNTSCVYACFFESPISKDKENLLGRNRAPHPFSLNVKLIDNNCAILTIVFIGISRNYIPYITLALERAGNQGISKSKTKYVISKITSNNEIFNFDVKFVYDKSKKWPSNIDNYDFNTVVFNTPCRIKSQGHYLDTVNAMDFIIAMERRVKILDSIYGDNTFTICKHDEELKSISTNQRWTDLNYYSGRQKTAMKIGGVLGSFLVISSINSYYKQIFYASEIFNIGKNISMGLGSVLLTKEVFKSDR